MSLQPALSLIVLHLRDGYTPGDRALARLGLPAQTFALPEPLMLFHAVLHPCSRKFAKLNDSGLDLRPMLPIFNGSPGHAQNNRDLLICLTVLG